MTGAVKSVVMLAVAGVAGLPAASVTVAASVTAPSASADSAPAGTVTCHAPPATVAV